MSSSPWRRLLQRAGQPARAAGSLADAAGARRLLLLEEGLLRCLRVEHGSQRLVQLLCSSEELQILHVRGAGPQRVLSNSACKGMMKTSWDQHLQIGDP